MKISSRYARSACGYVGALATCFTHHPHDRPLHALVPPASIESLRYSNLIQFPAEQPRRSGPAKLLHHEVRCLMIVEGGRDEPVGEHNREWDRPNLEAVSLMAAAVIPVLPRYTERCHAEMDTHTKQDIGIEPGSITWL